jgi:hypothetical protein
MKKLLIALVVLAIGIGFIGCSKTNPVAPTTSYPTTSIYQRPTFIDTRPEAVKQQFTLSYAEPVALDPAAKAGKYALCIGISAYAPPNTLNYCDDDANDWAAYLTSKGYTVTKLIDKAATKTAIESAVNTLASKAIAGNTIAFVYSGHGGWYSGTSNMISVNLYYMSATWLAGKFANATSTKMFFTFDACEISGMKTKLNKTGRVIDVASGGSGSYSYDGNSTMKNGVFTYYQMVGFYSQGYTYAEADASYACTQMKSWGTSNGVTCSPSYGDYYTGSWTF